MHFRRAILLSSFALILAMTPALQTVVDAQGKGRGNGGGGGGSSSSGYQFVDLLGFDDNGYQSSPWFVTNRDTSGDVMIAGESRLYPDPSGPSVFHPCLWRVNSAGLFPSTDPLDLGLPSFALGIDVEGMTSEGVVVVDTQRAVFKDEYDDYIFPAYVDMPGFPYLELPATSGRNTNAHGMNDAGKIIGDFWYRDPSDPSQTIIVNALWQLEDDGTITGPVDLGEFRPEDINNHGVMAGKTYYGWPAVARFVDGELEVVEFDSDPRLFGVTVSAINDLPFGDPELCLVGVAYRDQQGEPSGLREGFALRIFGTLEPLNMLGDLGGDRSIPFDVNRQGEVVGYATNGRNYYRAFLYSDGSMRDLNSFVDTGKAVLVSANAINEAGDVIGEMDIPRPVSERRGFLLRKESD